ncbi:MAG: condensation domain-containing protein [Filifactoraceae bacterium]
MKLEKDSTDLELFEYVNELKRQKIFLFEEDKKLKYRIKKELYSKDLINEIKENKDCLLRYLSSVQKNTLELSPLQLAYMAGQIDGEILNKVNAHYYIEFEKQDLNVAYLEENINLLIRENDILRLVLLSEGNGIILGEVPKYKVSQYMYETQEDRYETRRMLSHIIYNTETWPMFNFVVGKKNIGENKNDVLHISFDCSILDAWSAGKMIYKLFALYEGEKVSFSNISYKEYVEHLKKYKELEFNKKLLSDAKSYWDSKIMTLPKTPDLRVKVDIDNLEEYRFERKEYWFSKEQTDNLIDYSKRKCVTLSAVAITIYMKVLSILTDTDELTITTTLFGKLPVVKNIDELLGEFTNIGLLSYKDNHQSILGDIKETQKQIFKLLEYRCFDGINIVNKIRKQDKKNTSFPIVVTCMIGENYNICKNGFREICSLSQTPQVYLDHHIRMIDGRMVITFDYVDELFYKEDINWIVDKYIDLVNDILF